MFELGSPESSGLRIAQMSIHCSIQRINLFCHSKYIKHIFCYVCRLMQKAGVRPHMQSDSKSPEWFEDQRYQPNQQAQYLKKLSRLREDLIHQDIYNNKKRSSPEALQRGELVTKQKEGGRNGYNAVMDRQKKIQMERMKYFQKHRGRQDSERVGRIDVRPLTDVTSMPSTEREQVVHDRPYESARTNDNKFASNSFANERVPKMSKVSLPYLTSPSENFASQGDDIMHHDVINDMIENERRRSRDRHDQDLFPGHYTSSIPNIGRRALKHPGVMINHPFDIARGKQDSCIKQVSIHKKDRRGLYKGKKSSKKISILRADADEMDLSPDFISFYSSKYLDDNDTLLVPCTTPIPNLAESENGQYRQYTKDDLTELRRQFHRHRTHTETEMDAHHTGRQGEGINHSTSKSCVFCKHPEMLPFAIPASEYMVLPGDKSTHATNHATDLTATNHIPKLKFAEERPNKKLSVREKRRNIVVDVPQVEEVPSFVVQSPSPNVSFHHEVGENRDSVERHRNGVLYKTFKQNELRKREISNLLEDVKELNQLTRHLEEGASEDEEMADYF